MPSDFDASEFVDDDFQSSRKGAPGGPGNPFATPPGAPSRAPSREEVEARVSEMQGKLADLRRAQQELERERATLEDLRRRQTEFQTGRSEMVQNLTRGIGLLEEAEFAARRDAEQMAKTLADFRDALGKVQALREETWTQDSLNVELTRALTAVESARMEWNAARLKFPVLSGAATPEAPVTPAADTTVETLLREKHYAELCKLGLALTWPLALVALAIFLVLLLR